MSARCWACPTSACSKWRPSTPCSSCSRWARSAHIQVCGTTPCMLRGAEDLKKVCQNRIHHEPHHLSDDGDFSWEEVECLGACVNAPMVQIFKDTYEDLTPASARKADRRSGGRQEGEGRPADRPPHGRTRRRAHDADRSRSLQGQPQLHPRRTAAASRRAGCSCSSACRCGLPPLHAAVVTAGTPSPLQRRSLRISARSAG